MSRSGRRIRIPEVARRQRTRRIDATTVLAVVLPLLTVGVLALVRQPPTHTTDQPPALTQLTRSLVVCPSAAPGSPDAAVSTTNGTAGNVTVLAGTTSRDVAVRPWASTPVTGTGTLTVKGSDALAPGLLAARAGTSPVTGLDCPNPASDQWFTGVGARSDHDSVIELTNPDSGPAVADISLLAHKTFSVRRLRGITIPGHKTVTLELGSVVPRRPLLTAHVVVSRGRLAVGVLDMFSAVGGKQVQREWLPRQLAPEPDSLLLGLPTGSGSRTLQLANPTADVVRAEIRIVTGDTSFVPAGMKPVTIAPGSTVAVSLTQALGKALGDGAVGVAIHATGAVTASLRTTLAGDRVLTVPDQVVGQEAATLLPVATGAGAKQHQVSARVLLAADASGSVTVTAYDASGTRILQRTVGTQKGRVASITLPTGAALVDVVPKGTTVNGSVVVTGQGATVIPLHELLVKGLVPQISPGQD
ncbi:DUF5719 family protein [Nocardioides cynanchi]|uniref:DUF5719 family protein n=1 Tax=Nocardioides cynanchi TaxID=2558918 RepID=UPI001246CAB9|nr:DUF5719 family protein [Nocardioides cynanchi]